MTIRERILSLLSREVKRAYRARDIAIDNADYAAEKSKNTSKMLDRAMQSIDVLTEVAKYWREEANAKDKLFCDIIKEIEGAEDLHNLRQIVRTMAYRAENSGIIVQGSGEEPKVTPEPMEVV